MREVIQLQGTPGSALERSQHGRRYQPIESYALIGDGYAAALVCLDGSVDWLCLPRFDSPSVFGRVLDAERGGYWQVVPCDAWHSQRRYLPDTNVLLTTFETATGKIEIADFMPARYHETEAPGDNALVRIVRCLEGVMEVRSTFAPRFDYGRATAEWAIEPGVGVRAVHAGQSLTLYTSAELRVSGDAAEGYHALAAGDDLVFFLAYDRRVPAVWRSGVPNVAARLLEDTAVYWRDWAGRSRYTGPYAEAVRRSALTLKLLDYAPTGAIIAAPTTSLPEEIGGERNWDYRYSWLRDTAFTLYALYGLGYTEEGEAFLDWILDVARGDPANLQVLYGVGGEKHVEEEELPHLEGYECSRPVRVGNAAYAQLQLDIYGEVVDCAYLHHKHGGVISDDLWSFVRGVADHVCTVWREPDFGIWEVRSDPQHFVYSKVMCWVALDRALRLARGANLQGDLDGWEHTRTAILEELVDEGYDERLGAFTRAYASSELDAASLALVLRGVLPADDPRMCSTVDRVAERLGEDGFIHRYAQSAEDGLSGGEGAFMMCSFWLADCYSEMGRTEQARDLFEQLLAVGNDVGLYAEEYDPCARRHLGNFPQAFTHIALINAALSQEKLR